MINITNFFKSLGSDKEKRKKLLLIGGVALAAAVCIVLVLVIQNPGPGGVGAAPASAGGSQTGAQSKDNHVLASALSTGAYKGTVLAETPDAGADYAKETLFIGDSNTAGMINYSSVTNVSMNNGIGIVSMGISNVTSLKCVKFSGMPAVAVPEAVKIMQPRRIVITYGTNDFYMTPEKFHQTYSDALDAITKAYPYSDIIIGSVFPITANCSYYTVSMPIIEKFNVELVKLAQEKNMSFLNWSEALKDPVTGYSKPAYMSPDGLHLNEKGMEVIAEYFRTHALTSEDKRPKPLNPIPAREATPAGLLSSGPSAPAKTPETTEPETTQSLVSVIFSAGTGGTLSTGGASYAVQVAPGTTVGPVTAIPQTGYTFKGWTGAASSGSASISFTVPASAASGTGYSLTAVFEKTAATGGDSSGGGTTNPPSGGGTTNPPSGGGTTNPPGGGGTTNPPGSSGTTNPPGGSGTTNPPGGSGTTNPPSGGGTTNPPGGSDTAGSSGDSTP
ncbi:MAG: SGNH/GDSL hydrolase family protein [Clostridiales bacterium]|nr:SGNH/GDSL hydrolase family protein [Clostridiales bacterium]